MYFINTITQLYIYYKLYFFEMLMFIKIKSQKYLINCTNEVPGEAH